MNIFFRPSVALYHEFVQGRTLPYSAYLICGPDASGVCLGSYDLTVIVPEKRVLFFPEFSYSLANYWTAPYDFDCLTFYSFANPEVEVANADITRVEKGDVFCLKHLLEDSSSSYEQDLQKVISA